MDFNTLIQQPESLRDNNWEDRFLSQFPTLNIQIVDEEPKPGPDGWPYLFVKTGPEGTEPTIKVIQWLVIKGVGLVVNPHKMMPDYVFTYGMLWNFAQTGSFITAVSDQKRAGEAVYSASDRFIFGPPSEAYLPSYVRSILTKFLAAQGFVSPKFLVVSTEDYKQVDLLLSLASIGELPKNEHRTFAEMLGWFLPQHYNLVLSEEKGLPAFHSL